MQLRYVSAFPPLKGDQHRGKSIYGIGVLACRSREIFRREGIKSSIRHGMPIDQE